MRNLRQIFVVDTNILVDYVDIIPGGTEYNTGEPTIDLSGAHIVIPEAVIQELSSFKNEKTDRGAAARTVLRRLRDLGNGTNPNINDTYLMDAPIYMPERNQMFSTLPLHKDFHKCLPFDPLDDDMDGQIILTTLAAMYNNANYPIDGTIARHKIQLISNNNVTLLTNDNGLAIRARLRGIRTRRYGYKYSEPYTGRRDVVVPRELFDEFYYVQRVDRILWEKMMPSQPRLIANEFIVMHLEDENDYPSDFDARNDPFFSYIGRYDAFEEAIVKLRYVKNFPIRLHNAGQAIYAEALMNPDIAAVICTGVAGSGKTYMATVYGYNACKKGDFIGVTVIPCDSKSKLGALPGDLDEKMDPEVQPIKNALRNYLLNEDPKFRKELENFQKFGTDDKPKNGNHHVENETACKKSIKARLKDRVDMMWDNFFSNIPIEHARGRDFSYELAIYDEFQDQNVSQADTLIKRLGADGKIIITGDIGQIHVPYIDQSSSGLTYASRQLMDSPMVAQVHFIEEEVIRHPLVKMLTMRQKENEKH